MHAIFIQGSAETFSKNFCLQIPMVFPFCDAGEVLLDGENIKNLKLEWLRSQIGLVTQEPALLSLSIRDNIAYGRDATMDQIEEAAKIAHAHTFITSLEGSYETQVNIGNQSCPYLFYVSSFFPCCLLLHS